MIVIGPTKRVRSERLIRQTAAAGLREGKRNVDVAAMIEHQVSEIVGCQRVIGLNLKCLLVITFGLLPFVACLKKAGERHIEMNVSRVGLEGALIAADSLVNRAAGDLNIGKKNESSDIVLI